MRKIPKLIYNDDSCSLREVEPPHSKTQIARAVDYLADAGVDRLCWCVGWTGLALAYRSKVIDNYTDLAVNDSGKLGKALRRNLIYSLEQQGIDYLPILIAETRKRGMEFFASFRVNDCHAKGYPRSSLASGFWREHPEYRLWAQPAALSYYNGCFDYSFPEIQDRLVAVINEFVSRYEIDGIELDFLREPYLFPPGSGWKSREIITDLLRRIRNLSPAIMARLPLDEKLRAECGIDLESIFKNNLLDSVTAGTHALSYNESLAVFADLCRSYGIPFFGDMETVPVINHNVERNLAGNQKAPRHNYNFSFSATELKENTAGAAANLWGQGVDGIYLYNFACRIFEPGGRYGIANSDDEKRILLQAVSQCRSPEALAQQPRHYMFWDNLPIYAEALRPERFSQQVTFRLFGDILPDEKIDMSFRVYRSQNPHCGEMPCNLPDSAAKKLLHCRINSLTIDHERINAESSPTGVLPSGFSIGEHEIWRICLNGNELQSGENLLGFCMPDYPYANTPYIYIHDLQIHRS
jgi:hypothetical protein